MAGHGAAKLVIQHNGSFRRPGFPRNSRRAPGWSGRAPGSAPASRLHCATPASPMSGRDRPACGRLVPPRSEGTTPVTAPGAAS